MYAIVNPELYKSVTGSSAGLLLTWSSSYAFVGAIQRLTTYVDIERVHIEQSTRDAMLSEALAASQFTIAELLLRCDARPTLSISCQSPPSLGSLPSLARSRYHTTLWHSSRQPFPSERAFWRQKKRVTLRVLDLLRRKVTRTGSSTGLLEYRRELNRAFVFASLSDAHSVEMMSVLQQAGADVDFVVETPWPMNALFNAVDEDVPSLLRAKVDFLVSNGARLDSAISWTGPKTPMEHIAGKLSRNRRDTGKGYLTDFVNLINALRYVNALTCRLGSRQNQRDPQQGPQRGPQQVLSSRFLSDRDAVILSDLNTGEEAVQRLIWQRIEGDVKQLTDWERERAVEMGYEYHRLERLWREWCLDGDCSLLGT
ncbi:hypothetical protein CcaCcLH18_14179 [Colletotrichum camelliae]|nr:hypothetical protein CcaCcLH18_14179 [Colletotrichum camelliae]